MKEKAAIIGTLNMEMLLKGISGIPQQGRQIFIKNYRLIPAGSAIRVAFPLSLLGVKSFIIGKTGNDSGGDRILQAVRSCGLSTTGIEREKTIPTGICISFVRKDGERSFVSFLGAVSETDENFLRRHYNLIKKIDFLLISGYWALSGFKNKAGLWKKFLRKAKVDGKHILLDTGWDVKNWPKKRKDEILALLPFVDTFLPNSDEARCISGKNTAEEMCKELVRKGASEVIIKLGRKGSAGYSLQEGFYRSEAIPCKAEDTTAAGEVFNAGILWGLTRKWTLKKRLLFANATAGLYISHPDTYPTKRKVNQTVKEAGNAE